MARTTNRNRRRLGNVESLENRRLMTVDPAFGPDTLAGGVRFPGDTDHDGSVEFADFLVVARNFGATDAQWEDGDFTGDRRVQFDDFALLAENFGRQIHPSIDGTGNNQAYTTLGSVDQPLARVTLPDYADGVGSPSGPNRPGPRSVSNGVVASPGNRENANGLSDLTWLFGQFIDHDIDLSESGDESLPITVPTGDLQFDPFGTGQVTMDFNRSEPIEVDGIRQQINKITAFIDGSVIYGVDQQRADAIRTFQGGKLLTSGDHLLPLNSAGFSNADGGRPNDNLFLAGDIRANENAGLTAMHTLWVREHNLVADEIASEDSAMTDEQIYQRARLVVMGKLQAITYNEFLPTLLGDSAIADYRGYDPQVSPTIANEFSTAAYRFGHSMLSSELLRLNPDGSTHADGNLALQRAFFNPEAVTSGGIESILLGASVQTAQEIDPFLVDDVRNFLFGPPGSGGLDLAALNIQRGRDHGLPGYNQIRWDLGMAVADTFTEISSDPEIQRRLAETYENVNDIDPWVGMLAEDHAADSNLGETATDIIADQFQRIRDGDRFYYENVFEGELLGQIHSTTLADIIQRNTSIHFSPARNVFVAEAITGSDATRGVSPTA